MWIRFVVCGVLLWSGRLDQAFAADEPDLIIHRGKIVTVDKAFSISQAMAIKQDRIVKVGADDEVLKLRGPATKLLDLKGAMVIPGLIDSHVHPNGAAMHEFDHDIPDMQSIDDVLAYVKSRAAALQPNDWIIVSQVFITRLKEQRYPTRAELDNAAPNNPVLFSTGPDASVNTLALKLSGIDKNFQATGRGFIEKDPTTGEPTGILRSCTRYVKSSSTARKATAEDRLRRLKMLFADYNSVGITGVADRAADRDSLARYRMLQKSGELNVRVAISRHIDTDGKLEDIQESIRQVAADPLTQGDSMLRIVGIKTFLDGGMLTGSAYMRQPWGVSQIYSIQDPQYRGVLFIPRERLLPIVQTAVDSGLQFTAHSVGDGAVHALLDVYEEIGKTKNIRKLRPCLTHSNFMSAEAVQKAAVLGVVLDIQPAWLYLDGKTLRDHFGESRLRYFQPLKTLFAAGAIAGGGSDHMQKIGSLRSVNPYNPFLGMGTTVKRVPRGLSAPLYPEESLSREQMLRFYTVNNAWVTFQESQTGSLEPGKQADFVIVDTDLLNCDADAIEKTQVQATYLAGRRVYSRQADKAGDD